MKSGTSARTAGMLIAAAVALVTTGVVIFVAVSSQSGGSGTPTSPFAGASPDEGVAPPVVDVTDVTQSLQEGKGGRAELYAKDDPSRITAHLEWERFEPKPGGWIDLIQPRVWLYTKDGKTVYVRSESATLKTPSLQQTPESGILREAVVIKLFPERVADENGVLKPIEPDSDMPGVMAVTDTLSFDMLLSELTTPDHVRVETAAVKAEWKGLTARFNQTRQTLEYARFDSDGDVWVYPQQAGKDKADQANGRTAAAAMPEEADETDNALLDDDLAADEVDAPVDPQGPTGDAAEVKETRRQRRERRRREREEAARERPTEQLYQAVFVDDIRVERGSVTLTADVMRVLLRTIDGKLPDDAFGKQITEKVDEKPRHIERRWKGGDDLLSLENEAGKQPDDKSDDNAVFALYVPGGFDVNEIVIEPPPIELKTEPYGGSAATVMDKPIPTDGWAGLDAPKVVPDGHERSGSTNDLFPEFGAVQQGEAFEMWIADGSIFSDQSRPNYAISSTKGLKGVDMGNIEPRPEPRVGDPNLPIHLTWTGVLEVLSIDPQRTPDDLSPKSDGTPNHLAVRWISESDTPVLVTENTSGGWGECDTLDYHATTRTIALISGTGDREDMAAWVELPGSARGTFDKISINLGSGDGHAEGKGMLATTGAKNAAQGTQGAPDAAERSAAKAEAMGKQVAWQDGANFGLRTRNGWVGDGIEWAEFRGGAFAHDERSSIRGERLRVDFEHEGTRSPSRLARLTVEGDAVALAETADPEQTGPPAPPELTDAGTMKARRLEVEFTTDERNDTIPTYVWAEGDVLTGKDGDIVAGHTLEAELMQERSDEGRRSRTIVRRAEVTGSEDDATPARITRADGSVVTARRVVARADTNTADVFGAPAVMEKDGARIFGDQMTLSGGSQDADSPDGAELFVFGKGRFEMQQTARGNEPERRTVATWTKSMSYDDAKGRLDCSGVAEVESWQGESAVDRMRAERIYVDISTPSTRQAAPHPTGSGNAASTNAGEAEDERRVVRVEAVGSIVEADGGVNAHVESRRYAAAEPITADAAASSSPSTSPAPVETERRLVQLFYLEGPRIIANDVDGTVSVPAAGKAVIVDRRDEQQLTAAAARPTNAPAALQTPGGQGPSGTSQFVWAGSALFTRPTGVLDLRDSVELLNKPLGDEPVVRLTCSHLLATIVDESHDVGDGTNVMTTDGATLRSVEAIGSIYTQQDGTSLTADRLFYDAPIDQIVAEATGDNRVSMNDARQATPVVARRLRWNLRTDRVDIIEPAGINTPRQ